jgi:hypothetical protein
MQSISESYLYSICEINTLSNKLITTGYLGDILNEAIQISNNNDFLPILHCNTPVKINIYNNTLGYKVLIGKVFLSAPDMMQITDIQNLTDFERRNYFRLEVEINTQAYLIEEDMPDREHPIDITVTDLSLSGIFISTREYFEAGQKFVATLSLYDMKVPFRCQVQRQQSVDYSHNGYGCAFLDSSSRQFDLLCNYIFDKQREQIKKSREAQA